MRTRFLGLCKKLAVRWFIILGWSYELCRDVIWLSVVLCLGGAVALRCVACSTNQERSSAPCRKFPPKKPSGITWPHVSRTSCAFTELTFSSKPFFSRSKKIDELIYYFLLIKNRLRRKSREFLEEIEKFYPEAFFYWVTWKCFQR